MNVPSSTEEGRVAAVASAKLNVYPTFEIRSSLPISNKSVGKSWFSGAAAHMDGA